MQAHVEIVDMDTIRARHKGYWFERDTMRFFRSRVGGYGFSGDGGRTAYFVSSEQFRDPRGVCARRAYTVRVLDADGDVDTVGQFQAYASRSGAIAKARAMAEQSAQDAKAVQS